MNSEFKKKVTILPLLIWQMLFFFLPLVFLFYKHFSIYNFYSITQWLISNNFLKIIFNTLKCSLLISLLSIFIGYILAYCIVRQSPTIQKICLFLFFIPFISSFLIHMLSLINLFYQTSIINTILKSFSITYFQTGKLLYSDFLVSLGYVYCYIPYAFIPLYNSLSKFNLQLLEASADLGATFFRSVLKVLIPNTKNAILTSFFLVYISASGEFIIPEILGGDKYMHIGSAISYTLLSANLIEYSVVMIILFIFSLIISSFIFYNLLSYVIYYLKKI